MKKFYFLFAAVLLTSVAVQAKIWRCNNVTGITADFTTVQAAHDGASAGDTIHLEPSINSYGTVTMTKRLSIISSGNFLAQNPGIQATTTPGFLGYVNIYDGAANGSVISVRFSGAIDIRNQGVSNITLVNCASITANVECLGPNVGSLYIEQADNIIVRNCWFAGIDVAGTSENIIISNNIIGNRIAIRDASSAIVTNNVIAAVENGGCQIWYAVNSTFANNIYNKGFRDFSGFTNCVVQNNLSANGGLPEGNGNQNNVDMSTVFVNAAGGYVDNAYQLKVGSPAIAAGSGGEDCGAFGGSNPYRLAATPAIPSIYKLVVPATPNGNSMSVIFSTKSNN